MASSALLSLTRVLHRARTSAGRHTRRCLGASVEAACARPRLAVCAAAAAAGFLGASAGAGGAAIYCEDAGVAAIKVADGTTLVGKVALVTGATGSIGAAVARDLAAQGCRIAVVDLNESKCEQIAAGLPTQSMGIAIDVSSEEAVRAGVARVTEQLGPVDILINVAGILSNNKAFETTADEWRRVHAINYDACFYLSKACMPHMAEQKWGRVVNLTSWAWKSGGLTAGTAYSASKGALVGLTFSLARQFAGDGVTVNGVAPCYVFSPMIMEQLTAEKRAELLQTIPVKRFCTPEEVSHAVLFLCSPLSGFITGEIVDMNGGFQMD